MGRDGREKWGVAEGEVECAVAAHRNSIDCAIGTARCDPVASLDEGEKFLQQKVFVAVLAVLGIDVETGAAVRRGDEEILELVIASKVVDNIPETRVDEELLVVAQAVQEIENGELSGLVGVEGGGEEDAVGNGPREDLARNGVALNASRSLERDRKKKEQQEETRRPVDGPRGSPYS